jgi:hypothetical protein
MPALKATTVTSARVCPVTLLSLLISSSPATKTAQRARQDTQAGESPLGAGDDLERFLEPRPRQAAILLAAIETTAIGS